MSTNKYEDQDDASIVRSLSMKNGGSILRPIASNSLLRSSIPGNSMVTSSMSGHSSGSLANSSATDGSTNILIGHRSPANSDRTSTPNEMCGLDGPDGEPLFGGRVDAFSRAAGPVGSYSESGMKSYENHYLNKRKLSSKHEDQCSLIENMSCIANGLDGRLDEEVFDYDYENNADHYQKKKVLSASTYKYSSSSDKSEIDLISFTDTDSISLVNDCGGGDDDRKDENEKHRNPDGKCHSFCAFVRLIRALVNWRTNWLIFLPIGLASLLLPVCASSRTSRLVFDSELLVQLRRILNFNEIFAKVKLISSA